MDRLTSEFNEHVKKVHSEILEFENQATEHSKYIPVADKEIGKLKSKQTKVMIASVLVVIICAVAGVFHSLLCLAGIIICAIILLLMFIYYMDLGEKVGDVNRKKHHTMYMIHNLRWRASELRRARNSEIAGRFEDAARIYEWFGNFHDAGAARKMGRTTYTEHTGRVINIELDLERMLARIQQEGLTIPYKCPSCGGGLKVTPTSLPQSLVKCQYCGYDLINLADFLRNVLS